MQRSEAADAGLPTRPISEIRGGDAAYNAKALRALLMGQPGPYRDAVLYNAAEALVVAGAVDNLVDGVEEAAEAIDKGLAHALLDCWIAYTCPAPSSLRGAAGEAATSTHRPSTAIAGHCVAVIAITNHRTPHQSQHY